MRFSIDEITVEIEERHPEGKWGFRVRYWVYDPEARTTYYEFQETFPTKEKMLRFAKPAALKHFQQNRTEIMQSLGRF